MAVWALLVHGLLSASGPVGVVLEATEAGLAIDTGLPEGARQAGVGSLVYPGQRIVVQSGTVRIAFCGTESASWEWKAPARVSIGVAPAAPELSQAVNRVAIQFCALPRSVESTRDAGAGERLPDLVLGNDRDARVRGLPAASLAAYNEASTRLQAGATDHPLVRLISRAAVDESSGLLADAVAAYREVGDYLPPFTSWARDHAATVRAGALAQLAGTPPGRTYVFVVGIDQFPKTEQKPKPIPPLKYAIRDADLVAEYFGTERGGGATEASKRLQLITGSKATQAAILASFAKFVAAGANPANTLIVYFATHGLYVCTNRSPGARDGQPCEDSAGEEPFIVAYDTDPEDPKTTGIRMSDLQELIGAQAYQFGTVLLFLDTCHSGNIGHIPNRRNAGVAKLAKDMTSGQGKAAVMAASTKMRLTERKYEKALEFSQLQDGHGVFTYFLIRGLDSATAPNTAGKVTFDALGTYVGQSVRQYTSDSQIPHSDINSKGILVVEDARAKGLANPLPDPLTPAGVREEPSSRSIPSSPEYVLLENRGQQYLIRYLRGEQVPQRREDFLECEHLFAEALRLRGGAPFTQSRMLFCRGRARIFDGEYAEAARLLAESIRLDPKRGYAYNAMGLLQLEESKGNPDTIDRAIQSFQDASRRAPYWAYPLHNLALAYEMKGSYAAAIATYRRAMELVPDAAYPAYNLGILLQKLNRFADARQYLDQALALPGWPRRSDGYNGLGSLYAARRRTAEARAAFKNALQIDAGNVLAEHNLALLEAEQENAFPAAASRWRRIIQRAEPSLRAVMQKAFATSAEVYGNAKVAIEAYTGLIAMRPDDLESARRLVLLHAAVGEFAAALALAPPSSKDAALLEARAEAMRLSRGTAPRDPYLKAVIRREKRRR